MNSMTGYGFFEEERDGTHVSVEIRSVNSRFLDLNVNIPPFLLPLEAKIRALVSKKAMRGKIDVTIRVRDNAPETKISVNLLAAKSYATAILNVNNAIQDVPNKISNETLLSLVLAQDGVLNVEKNFDAEKYWEKIEPSFLHAFEDFLFSRKKEGENLKRDLLEKLSKLDECSAFFKNWQPQMETRFKEQVTSKFEELLGERVDENRIMTEVAAMIVRYTINEEIVRLQSHLSSIRDEIEKNPNPGKRLDFFCQEANREINTIGSKNQFAEVGAKVVDAKDSLENIREQAKNVE